MGTWCGCRCGSAVGVGGVLCTVAVAKVLELLSLVALLVFMCLRCYKRLQCNCGSACMIRLMCVCRR